MSVEVNIEFEQQCRTCYGRSTWMTSEPCASCRSTGRVPTELGRDLLEFLEHQGFKPTLNQPEQATTGGNKP